MAVARRGALHAVIQSTHRVAVEAYTALVVRMCREGAGAWAVIAPWSFLRMAARVAWTPAVMTNLLLRSARRMGPVAGAAQALRLAVVRMDGDQAALCGRRWMVAVWWRLCAADEVPP